MKTAASTLVFIFFLLHIFAQDEVFNAYTIDDGLPENTSNALLQDHLGRIWIGTQAGVSIYDGVRFTTIGVESSEQAGLTNNMVEAIYQDENNNIWVGTRNGINKIGVDNSIQHLFLDTTQQYGENFINKNFIETENHIWCSSHHTVFKIGKNNNEITLVEDFKNTSMTRLLLLGENLYCSADSSLYLLENNHFKKLKDYHSLITSLDKIDGNLWVSTYNGLFNIEGKMIFEEIEETIPLYSLNSQKYIWIGTAKGLFKFNKNNKTLVQITSNESNNLNSDLHLAAIEDANGNFWFGTGAGLYYYNLKTEKINRITNQDKWQLPSIEVNSITYSKNKNTLAIGTEKGLLISHIHESENSFELENQSVDLNESINFLNSTQDGNIWIGTKSGKVFYFDSTLHSVDTTIRLFGIRGFIKNESNNDVWIATSRGIFCYRNGKIIQPEWISEINYSVALLPKENGFWVSHNNNIYSINWNEDAVNKLNSNDIPGVMLTNKLKLDSLDLYSSISDGVFSYNISTNKFGEIHLLKGKNVWSTFTDNEGRFWSNTDDGIYVHNGKTILKKLQIEEGLNYNDFSMSAQCQLNNQTLIYGNKKGLSIIQPNSFHIEKWNAQPFISELDINYKSSSLDKLKNKLILEPSEKTIKIHLGLSDFINSQTTQVSYRLVNFKDEWSTFSPIQEPLNFTGLPAGEYVLEVRIKDKSDRISENILNQNIIVLPYFYETWWFKTILLILLGILLYLIASYRALQKQKAAERKLATEKALTHERERISRDLHDSIGAQLTKIASDLDIIELKADLKGEPIKIEDINKTREFTLGTITNLRETIWTLDTKIVTVADLQHQLNKYLERYLPESIDWSLIIEQQILQEHLSPNVAVNVFRILQELTQNMLKYSEANQFIINFKKDKNYTILTKDNGKGFDWQTTSKGEGLTNIQKRLEEIKGTVDYQNNNGSLFTITF